MTEIKNTTKKAQEIINDYNRAGYGSIFQAYGRPSSTKVNAWLEIERRATQTAGYNHDLKVCGAGSFNFSTIYSYTENGHTHIIKDTAQNIYKVTI